MEMCYDGALVMPSSYAMMDEEEMMYVEGGNGWYNERNFIAAMIDISIAIFTAGQAIAGIYAMKKFLKNNSRKLVKNVSKTLTKYIGNVRTAVITCAIEVALIAAGTSIGGLIAYALDCADGNENGYVFG